MQYYQVFISAEIRPQGLNILDHLISKQLVLGGPVFSGAAKISVEGRFVRAARPIKRRACYGPAEARSGGS